MMHRRVIVFVALLALLAPATAWSNSGELEISIVDRETKQPIYGRMHLKTAAGRPVKPPKTIAYRDHFIIPGKALLKLPVGSYTFELECGLEYLTRSGHFTINTFASDATVIDMKRFADMAKEGWWAGDLDVHRTPRDLPFTMQADGIHVVPLFGSAPNQGPEKPAGKPAAKAGGNDASANVAAPFLSQFDTNRYVYTLNQLDHRGGGAVGLLNLRRALPLAGLPAEAPSQLAVMTTAAAQSDEVWCDVQQHASWDLPVWVAAGKMHSLQLANSHLLRDGIHLPEPIGVRPRDRRLFPDPRGNARWSHEIYYHLLDCGLRIAPTAGSGSGLGANPVGYNRVYAYIDGEFSYEKWFAAVKAGRTMVTNGPLIRPTVEGERPGYVFRADEGDSFDFEIALTLSTRDKIHYLEIVRDGEVEHEIRLADFVEKGGMLPRVKFTKSGWFLIRAVTEVQKTYRYAMTAPYYVNIGDRPRISRKSTEYFLEWLDARKAQLKLPEGEKGDRVLAEHAAARRFWVQRREMATVD